MAKLHSVEPSLSDHNRNKMLAGALNSYVLIRPTYHPQDRPLHTTAFAYQANSAVRFGIIGTGGRGQYVGTLMAKDPNARITAICDIYPDRIDAAKTKIPGADKAKTYRDYHELLNDKDIDAVLIATPVFLHPEHFEAAVLAQSTSTARSPPAPMSPAASACSQRGKSATRPSASSSDSSSASARSTSRRTAISRAARSAR